MLPSATTETNRVRIRLTPDSLLSRFSNVDHRLVVYLAAVSCIPLSFFVYWPRINDFFVFDDFLNLAAVRNHSFPAGMVRAFDFTVPRPMDPAIPSWRPLIDIYFYAAKPVGLHSQPFHAVNFALHGLVGALAVLLLFRLHRSTLAATATGVLFVVAPTYDYAVSWIGQASELLGYALILSALISYHVFLTSQRRYPGSAIVSFACVFFALLTKESTVILAVLLPALVLAVPPDQLRRSGSEIRWSLGPPLVMLLVFVIAMQVANELLMQTPDHFVGVHVAHNWWRFLEWLVLPHQPGELIAVREVLGTLFLLAGVASLVRRNRVLSFLFVWTAVAIVPFAMFDHAVEFRYAYLAALPFTAFVVLGLEGLVQELPKRAAVPGYMLLVSALALAVIVAPMRTRDAQAGFAFQSHQYELMVDGVRNLCGQLQSGNSVYVAGSGIIDFFGHNVDTAVNLYYDRVHAVAVPELPPLAAFIEDKCVIQYDWETDSYRRVE
jgi:hypothetical protein